MNDNKIILSAILILVSIGFSYSIGITIDELGKPQHYIVIQDSSMMNIKHIDHIKVDSNSQKFTFCLIHGTWCETYHVDDIDDFNYFLSRYIELGIGIQFQGSAKQL